MTLALDYANPLCRRMFHVKNSVWFKLLTLAQKYAAAELAQFGYQLQFIRGEGEHSQAIFTCDDKVVTVDAEGEIDLSPIIKLRK